MGVIKQLSQYEHLIPLEHRAINITQWKMLKPKGDGLEITICESVFFIEGINVELLNEINAKNKTSNFIYEFIRSSLRCSNCNGTGIVDWVDKATKVKEHTQHIFQKSPPRYIRDKKGSVNILSYDSDDHMLTSVPNKRIGEEYCSECYGCGIKLLPWIKKVDVMYFDKC